MIDKIKTLMKEKNIETIVLINNENENVAKNVFYVSGFSCSSCIVVINKDFDYLITDFRYETVAKLNSKLNVVIHKDGAFTELKRILNEHNINEVYIDDKTFFADYVAIIQFASAMPLDDLFLQTRSVKSDEEIAKIKKACDITDKAYDYLIKNIKPGMSEINVAKMLEIKLFELGATKLAFDTIVASGVRGALPHAFPTDKIIELGELVTIDFGCYYENYTSDMTRTFAVGNISSQLQEIYDVVLTAQELGVKAAKAGISGKELDEVCRIYIDSKGYGEYFGHGTGHGIGLDVHELPTVSRNSAKLLLEGQVVTIEPGIYIPNVGGVRIEDDVLIKKDGCEILNNTPKKLVIIQGE